MTKDIFGTKIKVRFKKLHPDLDGLYCYDTQTILIDKSLDADGATLALIHEMAHAMLDVLGIELNDQIEELIIDNYTKLLFKHFDITPK
jgi:hypothetical protein